MPSVDMNHISDDTGGGNHVACINGIKRQRHDKILHVVMENIGDEFLKQTGISMLEAKFVTQSLVQPVIP